MEYTFGAGGDRPVAGRWSYSGATCTFKRATGANVRVLRAPILNNPPIFNASFTGLREVKAYPNSAVIVSRYADENASKRWLYVERQDVTNGQIQGWIEASHLILFSESVPCNFNSLFNETSKYFPIPNLSWSIDISSTSTPIFKKWPIEASAMCSNVSIPKGFWGLNRAAPGSEYPRNAHPGVDFFVNDSNSNLPVVSMSDGIIAGIGIGKPNTENNSLFESRTHNIWGSAYVNQQESIIGYSVIIRSGYLYILYGHLKSLEPNIWVGAKINAGDMLGTLGKVGQRHLHLEIHSYGSSTNGFYVGNPIRASGILPTGGNASIDVAPYVYDAVQLLPHLPQISGAPLATQVATENLSLVGGINKTLLSLPTYNSCQLTYETVILNILSTLDGYRTFHEFAASNSMSIKIMTTPPIP
jgi:murein DD-endopeptidase MepM/ murein hydrolase activator NlpD